MSLCEHQSDNKKSQLYLKKACFDDCDLLFTWANEEITRRNSFNTKPIEYKNHCHWFEELMKDPTREQYILMMDKNPVGQVRLCFEENQAEIGYSIDAQNRGLGYGKIIITKTIELIKREYPNIKILNAKVKPTNIASGHCFIKNGFHEEYKNYRLDVENI